MTLRHFLFGISLLGAAWLALFGDRTPDTLLAVPVGRDSSASAPVAFESRQVTAAAASKGEPSILVIRSRENSIRADVGGRGSIFGSKSWAPPPPSPAKVVVVAPSPPPLPFSYIGKKIEDSTWEVFVTRGSHALILREGRTIDGLYRIDLIKPPMLFITYLPLNQAQTLYIGAPD